MKQINVNAFFKPSYFNKNCQATIPGKWEAWITDPAELGFNPHDGYSIQFYGFGETQAEAVQDVNDNIKKILKVPYELIVTESEIKSL
jgi:hypothetical protein